MKLSLGARRRIVQAVSAIALNSNFGRFATEGFCIPVMNCEACAAAWLGCPIGLMGGRIGFRAFPLMVVASVVVSGLLFGRFLCGWVCPMGFLQDLLHRIPGPKIRLPRFLTFGKYAFLAISVVAVAWFLGKESGLFYCKICPTASLQVVIPTMIADGDWQVAGARALRLGILAVVLVLAVLNHRAFCKVMCPVGAMTALAGRRSLLAVRMNADKCLRCKACDRACPMDVKVEACKDTGRRINGDPECVECLTCESVCTKQAIHNNSRILKR